MLDAVAFLHDVADGAALTLGRHVAVYGGGNTAMDAARVARRLGARDTVVVYRRTREQMPAHPQEAADAEREGVRINWLRTVTALDGPELTVEVMELDESGYPRPTGRTETLAADTLIMALGQETESGFMRTLPGVVFDADGAVCVTETLMTGCPGVFAGGDMVPGERTVTVGVGHGRKAARHIDAWLRSQPLARTPKHPSPNSTGCDRGTSVTPRAVTNPSFHRRRASTGSPRSSGPDPGAGELRSGPVPVVRQLRRVRRLPRGVSGGAVIKLGAGHRYEFDYDACTGCGICAEQCPVHAIDMCPEPT